MDNSEGELLSDDSEDEDFAPVNISYEEETEHSEQSPNNNVDFMCRNMCPCPLEKW